MVTTTSIVSQPRRWLGITIALAAAAAFASANTSANIAYHGGTNPLTVASMRFLAPALALLGWSALSGISLRLPRRDITVAIMLGAVTAFYTWALLTSFYEIPFALAVLILYLFPLIAAVMLACFGWEKFSWRIGAAIAVAIAGLVLALDIKGGNLNLKGTLLAFCSAVGLAVVVVVSSRIFREGDSRPLTFYMAAAACVFLLAVSTATGDFVLPQTASGWGGLLIASMLSGFAMIAFFIAISLIGPVRTSIASYADPVVSAGLGVVVLGQALSMVQVVGTALVVLALINATVQGNRVGSVN